MQPVVSMTVPFDCWYWTESRAVLPFRTAQTYSVEVTGTAFLLRSAKCGG